MTKEFFEKHFTLGLDGTLTRISHGKPHIVVSDKTKVDGVAYRTNLIRNVLEFGTTCYTAIKRR